MFIKCKELSLNTKRILDRLGSLYEDFSIKRVGASFIGLRILSVSRKIGLGAAITFATENDALKFSFVIISSFALLTFLGLKRPYV